VIVNEALQWGALGIVGVLMLGILRQLSLMLPPELRSAAATLQIGDRISGSVMRRLTTTTGWSPTEEEQLTVAFVADSCEGCQRLLADLERQLAAQLNGNDPGARALCLVSERGSPGFEKALRQLDVPVLWDEGGELAMACGITATPQVLRLDSDGNVINKEVVHRVELAEPATA
jgi:hypothetical protein